MSKGALPEKWRDLEYQIVPRGRVLYDCKNIKSLRQDLYYDPSPLFQVMEYFLMPSQGIILWHCQLENILKLFFHPSEITFLRKGLGAHKPEVLDKMESISLNPSLTLADFLSNRMYVFRKYDKSPTIKAAYNLFRWLSS